MNEYWPLSVQDAEALGLSADMLNDFEFDVVNNCWKIVPATDSNGNDLPDVLDSLLESSKAPSRTNRGEVLPSGEWGDIGG